MFFAVRPSHFASRHNFNKATLSPFRNKVGILHSENGESRSIDILI